MTYAEGVDYFVRLIDFPNQAAGGVSVSNGDGTFSIFINTRCSPARQRKALEHELKHLVDNHFFRDAPIDEVEREARSGCNTKIKAAKGNLPLVEKI